MVLNLFSAAAAEAALPNDDQTTLPTASPTVVPTQTPLPDVTYTPDGAGTADTLVAAIQDAAGSEDGNTDTDSSSSSGGDSAADPTEAPGTTTTPADTVAPASTDAPAEAPTEAPTDAPSEAPADTPAPTETPAEAPTESPDDLPAIIVTDSPSPQVTTEVTESPSPEPTAIPDPKPTISTALLIVTSVLCVLMLIVIALLIAQRKKSPAAKKRAAKAGGKKKNMPSGDNSAAKPNVPSTSLITPKPQNAQLYQVGYAQTIGARPQQEDSYGASNAADMQLVRDLGLLAVVCDGIGGMANGQVASSSAIRAMLTAFGRQSPQKPAPDRLLQLAAQAQNSVLTVNRNQNARCGCTLVSVLLHNDGLSFLSIGDSRICLLRGNALLTLNREHVAGREHDENVAFGLTSESMEPRRRVQLTSYVGKVNLSLIDRSLTPIQLIHGDKVLLMSDGVFNALSDEELISYLQAPAQQAAEQIVRAVDAKKFAHQDNATVVVVEYP